MAFNNLVAKLFFPSGHNSIPTINPYYIKSTVVLFFSFEIVLFFSFEIVYFEIDKTVL